jgi:hypothetical protein
MVVDTGSFSKRAPGLVLGRLTESRRTGILQRNPEFDPLETVLSSTCSRHFH